jgi:hypothetical protein
MGFISDKFRSGRLHEMYKIRTWNCGTISAFPWRQKENLKNLCRVVPSECLVTSSWNIHIWGSDSVVDETEIKITMPQISLNTRDFSSVKLPIQGMTHSHRYCRQKIAPADFKLSPPSPEIRTNICTVAMLLFAFYKKSSSTKFALRSMAPHNFRALN